MVGVAALVILVGWAGTGHKQPAGTFAGNAIGRPRLRQSLPVTDSNSPSRLRTSGIAGLGGATRPPRSRCPIAESPARTS